MRLNIQQKPSFFRRHLALFLIILAAILVSGAFVSIEYLRVQREIEQDEQNAETRKVEYENAVAIYQSRLNAAHQAEENATTTAPTYAENCTPVANASAIDVVVNKTYCFDPLDWTPSDLTSIGGECQLRAEAAENYQAMLTAATNAGASFTPSSAFRSYSDQVSTYNYWVSANNSVEAADLVSARPGYSEHQTGLVVDLKSGSCVLECFATTSAYTWLTEHAADYGFIQRYPEKLTSITGYTTEAWHWRYVGTDIAHEMKRLDIKTLEVYKDFVNSV